MKILEFNYFQKQPKFNLPSMNGWLKCRPANILFIATLFAPVAQMDRAVVS